MQSHSAAPAVLQWNPEKKYSERERWICIYPAYVNSKKSIAEGRRLPKDRCVENPTFQEIRDVLVAAGLNLEENTVFRKVPDYRERENLLSIGCHYLCTGFDLLDLVSTGQVGVENKLYSRERSKELLYRGRIRVQLKNDDGSHYNSSFPTRDSVMSHLGDMIPKLKTRLNKPAGDQAPQTSQGKGKGKGKGRR